jgi:hypothetical protein
MSQGVPVVTINSSTPPSQYEVVGTGTSQARNRRLASWRNNIEN